MLSERNYLCKTKCCHISRINISFAEYFLSSYNDTHYTSSLKQCTFMGVRKIMKLNLIQGTIELFKNNYEVKKIKLKLLSLS